MFSARQSLALRPYANRKLFFAQNRCAGAPNPPGTSRSSRKSKFVVATTSKEGGKRKHARGQATASSMSSTSWQPLHQLHHGNSV